jgi:hypothetical protein
MSFVEFLLCRNFSYRGHLIQMIEPSKIPMETGLQSCRTCSKRLDLLENFLCVYDMYSIIFSLLQPNNFCNYFLLYVFLFP